MHMAEYYGGYPRYLERALKDTLVEQTHLSKLIPFLTQLDGLTSTIFAVEGSAGDSNPGPPVSIEQKRAGCRSPVYNDDGRSLVD